MSHQKINRNIPLNLLFIFLGAVVLIVILGLWFYSNSKEEIKNESHQELAAISSLKIDQIIKWRNERRGEALFISNNKEFKNMIVQYFRTKDKRIFNKIVEWIKPIKENHDYDEIYLNEPGKQFIPLFNKINLIDSKYDNAIINQTVKSRKILFSDFHRHSNGRIFLGLAVPLVNDNKDDIPFGAVFLSIDPSRILFPLIQSWPTLSKTAETLLIRREGNKVVFLNELRHQKNTALRLKKSIQDTSLPASVAVLGRTGIFEGVDYRGVKVVSDLNKIPDSPWYIISKVDESEIYRQLKERALWLTLISSILIIVTGLALYIIWKQQQIRSIRDLLKLEKEKQAIKIHFDHLMKYANDIIILFDENFKVITVNEKALNVYGYTKDEFLNLKVDNLRAPESLKDLIYNKEEVQTTMGYLFETFHITKSGNVFPVEVSSRSIIIDEKKYYQSIIRDITERKKIEEALNESEKKYRSVVESAAQPIFTINKDGIFLFMNKAAAFPFSIDADAISGKSMWELFPKEYADGQMSEIKKALNSGKLIHASRESLVAGKKRWYDARIQPVENDAGEYDKVQVVLTDITERKKAEDALRQTEFFLQKSQQVANIGSYYFNVLTGNWISSRALNDIFGIDDNYPKNIEGWVAFIHPDYKVEMQNYLVEYVIKDHNRFDKEYKIIRFSDEQERWVHGLGELEFDDQGNTTAMIGTIQDITERKLVEVTLRASEEKFSRAFMTSPDAININRLKDGLFIDINEGFTSLTGYTWEDVKGKTSNYINIWGDPNDRVKLVQGLIENGKVLNLEAHFKFKDGSIRIGLMSAVTIEVNNEQCILSITRDITERKQAVEQLQLLKYSIDIALDGVYWMDPEGKFIYVNDSGCKMLGYSREELLNMNVSEINPLATPERWAAVWKVLLEKKVFVSESVHRRKDGSVFPVELSSTYCKFGDQEYCNGFAQDITDRKKTQVALQESEEQYRKLVTTVPDIIVKTDLEGNIIFINDAELPYWSFLPKERILGKNLLEFIIPEDKNRILENMKLMFEKRLGLKEYRLCIDNSIIIDCEVNGDVLRDIEGKAIELVFVIRDVTKRKQIENELEKYRLNLEELIKERTNELEETNRLLEEEIVKQWEAEEKVKQALAKEKEFSELKSKFISIASHEFRTPLTVIYSSTELLQRYGRKWDESEYNEQIERVKLNVHNMTEIMDDVLTISRTETGRINYEPKKTDLKFLCDSIIEDVKLLLTSNHNLYFKYDSNENYFVLDERLVKYILMNLITNAIKYSVNGGKIEFIINSDKDNLLFEISDEGIGIPDEDQQSLFEPFHRGMNVREIHGTGLGMSIVKRSVDMHKGTITFTSKENAGTKFIITIPNK